MCVVSANACFCSTFGLTAEEVRGKNLQRVGNGELDIPELNSLLETVLRENKPFEGFEITRSFKNRGKKHIIVNAWTIQVEGTYSDRVLMLLHDVTEKKENEKRKDDFLRIASHELKAPVNNIVSFLDLAEMYVGDDNKAEAAEMLRMGANYIRSLGSLINDLLDVTRIRGGDIELKKSTFSFDEMVTTCVKNLQLGFTTHNIIVNTDTRVSVTADKTRLEQVIVNMVQNAVKYSPNSNSVHVSVAVINDFLKLSVADTGIGMDNSENKRIFERLYRVEETQHNFPGIGIGLYICDNIIKQHNGTMWVDSEKGVGSTFSFTLPLGE